MIRHKRTCHMHARGMRVPCASTRQAQAHTIRTHMPRAHTCLVQATHAQAKRTNNMCQHAKRTCTTPCGRRNKQSHGHDHVCARCTHGPAIRMTRQARVRCTPILYRHIQHPCAKHTRATYKPRARTSLAHARPCAPKCWEHALAICMYMPCARTCHAWACSRPHRKNSAAFRHQKLKPYLCNFVSSALNLPVQKRVMRTHTPHTHVPSSHNGFVQATRTHKPRTSHARADARHMPSPFTFMCQVQAHARRLYQAAAHAHSMRVA